MKQELLKDIEKRADIILTDNEDYQKLFKNLKSDLSTAYIKNDFRISVLKDFASRLIAIISLASNDPLSKVWCTEWVSAFIIEYRR